MQIPGQRDVRSHTGHGTRATGDGDISPRHIHTRAFDESASDRVPHGNVVQSAVDADVTHCRKAFSQKRTRVGNRLEGHLSCRFLDLRHWVAVVGWPIGQVCMAIDEPGQHRHLRQVDEFGIGRNGKPFAYGFNLVVTDEDNLVIEHCPGLRINQPPRLDCCHLGRSACGAPQPKPQH